METLPELHEHTLKTALHYLSLGYRPIPLVAGTKRAAIQWKAYQGDVPTPQEVARWFGRGDAGVALLTGNGVVVVDVDDPALVDHVLSQCGATAIRTQTARGIHLWYRMRHGVTYGNAVKIKGHDLDLRCEGAYVVVPPSVNAEGVPYRWLGPVLPATELPLLKVSWLRERKPKPRALEPLELHGEIGAIAHRARAYLAKIPGAISLQRGHNASFRVACVLVQKFSLPLELALPLMHEWNEKCEPPWSEKELLHKLQDAIRLRVSWGLKPIE